MLIVGIAGGTGSGKTTVVRKLIDRLPKNAVSVLYQDSYYKDNSHLTIEERKKINFDHPSSIEFSLICKHLKQLKNGKPVEEPTYSYLTCTRQNKTRTVKPNKVVIVEGILVLADERLRNIFDIKVFVSADADDRLMRVISRDIKERGRDVENVLTRYKNTVKPMHLQFIEPSKKYADIIIPQGGQNEVGINILIGFIKQIL